LPAGDPIMSINIIDIMTVVIAIVVLVLFNLPQL